MASTVINLTRRVTKCVRSDGRETHLVRAMAIAVQGEAGAAGATGVTGIGIPTGGATGQVLAKSSDADYATAWVNQTAGSGGSGGSPFTVWPYNPITDGTPTPLVFTANDPTSIITPASNLITFTPDANSQIINNVLSVANGATPRAVTSPNTISGSGFALSAIGTVTGYNGALTLNTNDVLDSAEYTFGVVFSAAGGDPIAQYIAQNDNDTGADVAIGTEPGGVAYFCQDNGTYVTIGSVTSLTIQINVDSNSVTINGTAYPVNFAAYTQIGLVVFSKTNSDVLALAYSLTGGTSASISSTNSGAPLLGGIGGAFAMGTTSGATAGSLAFTLPTNGSYVIAAFHDGSINETNLNSIFTSPLPASVGALVGGLYDLTYKIRSVSTQNGSAVDSTPANPDQMILSLVAGQLTTEAGIFALDPKYSYLSIIVTAPIVGPVGAIASVPFINTFLNTPQIETPLPAQIQYGDVLDITGAGTVLGLTVEVTDWVRYYSDTTQSPAVAAGRLERSFSLSLNDSLQSTGVLGEALTAAAPQNVDFIAVASSSNAFAISAAVVNATLTNPRDGGNFASLSIGSGVKTGKLLIVNHQSALFNIISLTAPNAFSLQLQMANTQNQPSYVTARAELSQGIAALNYQLNPFTAVLFEFLFNGDRGYFACLAKYCAEPTPQILQISCDQDINGNNTVDNTEWTGSLSFKAYFDTSVKAGYLIYVIANMNIFNNQTQSPTITVQAADVTNGYVSFALTQAIMDSMFNVASQAIELILSVWVVVPQQSDSLDYYSGNSIGTSAVFSSLSQTFQLETVVAS